MGRKGPVANPRDAIRSRVLGLPGRLRPEAADGLRAEWELRVSDVPYTVTVADGTCFAREGPSAGPATRIVTDAETWLAIDEGSLTGAEAFLARRLSVRGNLDLAVRLQVLFAPYGRSRGPLDVEQVELDVDGIPISAYVVGEGPPVVLLHGLGATKISWLPVIPVLSPRYRLVVPDLPGHGESGKPRTSYTPRFYAKVVRMLMDALDAPRAAVAGNSLGGRIALELASRSPDRITGLALLGPAVPGIRTRYVLGFTRVVPSEVGALPFLLRERWMQLVVRRLFADPGRLPEGGYLAAADEFIRVYREPAARMAFLDSLRHLVTEPARPFWARIRRVRVPVLILWGGKDRLVPVRLAAKLADALPGAELVVLPGVGHVPQFEVPEETTAALAGFLEKLNT